MTAPRQGSTKVSGSVSSTNAHAHRGLALLALIPAASRGFRLQRVAFDATAMRLTSGQGQVGEFDPVDRGAISIWANGQIGAFPGWIGGSHANDLYALGGHADFLKTGGLDAAYTAIEFFERTIEAHIACRGRHYVFTVPAGHRDRLWPYAFQYQIDSHPGSLVHHFPT